MPTLKKAWIEEPCVENSCPGGRKGAIYCPQRGISPSAKPRRIGLPCLFASIMPHDGSNTSWLPGGWLVDVGGNHRQLHQTCLNWVGRLGLDLHGFKDLPRFTISVLLKYFLIIPNKCNVFEVQCLFPPTCSRSKQAAAAARQTQGCCAAKSGPLRSGPQKNRGC